MPEPVMRVTDNGDEDQVFFVDGDSNEEAEQLFGPDIQVQHGYWTPRDTDNNHQKENAE